MDGQWTFYHRNGVKEKEGVLKEGNADGLWVFYDDETNKIQEGSFPMALKKVNGQRGLKMEEQQRDTMQMGKKTQLGLAGGIMKGLEKMQGHLRAEK